MKKIFILMILVASYSTGMQAENVFIANSSVESSWQNRGYKYQKGNISPDQLPSNIIKYLEKTYPDYTIMISKRKGDGYYYVKIRYNHDAYRPYYRSLVFNQNGDPVRG